jgi:hypothetical protein
VSEGSVPNSLVDSVYVIPSLDRPVLSVQQLAESGYTSVFPATSRDGGAVILDARMQVVAKAGDDHTVKLIIPLKHTTLTKFQIFLTRQPAQ